MSRSLNEPSSTVRKVSDSWNTLRKSSKGWPLFLDAVTVSGLRGWSAEKVEFRFPVVAIAGANGSGKSTVLKAAAAAYRARDTGSKRDPTTFYPDDFFPNTPWEIVENVYLQYKYTHGDVDQTSSLRKLTKRWRGMPARPVRPVFFLDVSRTQPIDTLIGYGKIAKESVFAGEEVALEDKYLKVLARVLGVSYEHGMMVTKDGKKVGVLEVGGTTYSNFHQGAGEDATTDLVAILQEVPRNSLIIIDEVESSLHPRAQRRLTTELLELALDRKLQIILSTHSPYVFEQLPLEARVYVNVDRDRRRHVLYGVTPEFALSMMDDISHPELVVYCEDAQSKSLVQLLVAIEDTDGSFGKRLDVVAVGPASTVQTLGEVADKGGLPGKAVGVLDGDQEFSPGCLVLPGGDAPERVVFNGLTEEQWGKVAQRLAVREGDLLDAVDDAKRLENSHTWPRRTAEALGARFRASRVWDDAAAVWAEELDADVRSEFVNALTAYLG
ncbi:AAA family ATPase [Lentzea alba]|uniref:AAA family ATPase n=1 Tax=Lentzea alba TaxID=2714351 RepID=UPI0039BFAF90